MIKTLVGLEALDLSSFQMKNMPNLQRIQWTERSLYLEYPLLGFTYLILSTTIEFMKC